MKNKIIKGITLALFSTLIIGFIAYRSGYIGNKTSSFSTSPNESTQNNQSDTIQKTDSIVTIDMISSSKSVVLRDISFSLKDSSKTDQDSVSKDETLMYSSKIGLILKPEDLKKIELDSILTDSLKK